MAYVHPESLKVPKWTNPEWEIINIIEQIEKYQFQLVFGKFQNARRIIQSCDEVFGSLKHICNLAMKKADIPGPESTGSLSFPLRLSNLPDQLLVSDGRDDLVARLFGLKDWMTCLENFTPDQTDNMYYRSCEISCCFARYFWHL